MPALFGCRPAIALERLVFLRCRQRRSIARIKAHRDHGKIIAEIERYRAQGPDQTVDQQRAKIFTAIIDEVEHHRPRAEVVAEANRLAALIDKAQIQRRLLAEPLLECHALKYRREIRVMSLGRRRQQQRRTKGQQLANAPKRALRRFLDGLFCGSMLTFPALF